jgi:hypothetical protein
LKIIERFRCKCFREESGNQERVQEDLKVGEIGLKWLKKKKEETGLLMGTEVANAAHVKLALEYDIDVLWIGART